MGKEGKDEKVSDPCRCGHGGPLLTCSMVLGLRLLVAPTQVQWREFPALLRNSITFNRLWKAFDDVDVSEDRCGM